MKQKLYNVTIKWFRFNEQSTNAPQKNIQQTKTTFNFVMIRFWNILHGLQILSWWQHQSGNLIGTYIRITSCNTLSSEIHCYFSPMKISLVMQTLMQQQENKPVKWTSVLLYEICAVTLSTSQLHNNLWSVSGHSGWSGGAKGPVIAARRFTRPICQIVFFWIH